MRQFLVTKLVCSKCGENMNMTYDLPTNSRHYAEGEPTGAAMVEQRVAVEPCQTCARPAVAIEHAVEAYLKARKEGK